MKENISISRGDVFVARLEPTEGSEQGGVRPVVIIQNDMGNRHSPTVIVAPTTGRMSKKKIPTHVELNEATKQKCIILLEQIKTIDKSRLQFKVGQVSSSTLEEINKAIKVSLGLK